MRSLSKIAPTWWDYTTLDASLLREAGALTAEQVGGLGREGFQIHLYDTLEEFYLAEALQYVQAWSLATDDGPVGVCGPIGPTEQLPLVARLVNALGLNLRNAHFWAMDEWVVDGKEVATSHPCPSAEPTSIAASTASTRASPCRPRISTFPRANPRRTPRASTRSAAR